jgi:hypothetical protein
VTVKELIDRLSKMPQDARMAICMDWTADESGNNPKEQWEDELGDLAIVNGTWVYLLNKGFK